MIRSIAEAPMAFHATVRYSCPEVKAGESQDVYLAIQRMCIAVLNGARSRNMTPHDLRKRRRAMTSLLRQKPPLSEDCRKLIERTRRQLRNLEQDNEFLPELERPEPRP